MARAALGWSLDFLAERSGISRRAILRFEQGESLPRERTLLSLRAALEAGGVRFAESGGVFPPPKVTHD
jgi:transcriptional regulator with XRE-family HTH domain